MVQNNDTTPTIQIRFNIPDSITPEIDPSSFLGDMSPLYFNDTFEDRTGR